MSERIRIQKDQFTKKNRPHRLRGFNYWPSNSPGSAPGGLDWSVLCQYDRRVIEREVPAMAEAGTNALRVWFAYTEEHWSADHHLLPIARKHTGSPERFTPFHPKALDYDPSEYRHSVEAMGSRFKQWKQERFENQSADQ